MSDHSAHSTALAHQFDDPEQQLAASTLGMWTFLVTEIMFFGGLFLGYALYRSHYPQAFAEASRQLNLVLGAINTAVLIGSSLMMVLAVQAAQFGHRRSLITFLLLTMLLGSVFLGIKAVEYTHKFHEHLVPGPAFRFEPVSFEITEQSLENLKSEGMPDDVLKKLESVKHHEVRGEKEFSDTLNETIGDEHGVKYRSLILKHAKSIQVNPQNAQLFFSFYFAMTGLHALHMIIGIGILTVLVIMARRGRFSSEYYTPVDVSGLYWHFVDIVWIFLFPLLYLISRT